jgi:hypothetical protein
MDGIQMDDSLLTVVLALITGGFGTAIVQAVINRKKNKVDISDVNVKTALSLTTTMEARLNKIQSEIDALRGYLKVCTDLLDESGIDYPTFLEFETLIRKDRANEH